MNGNITAPQTRLMRGELEILNEEDLKWLKTQVASLTGEDKTYTTTVDLPEIDTANPEIERLWAMAMIEQIEKVRELVSDRDTFSYYALPT